MLFIDVIVNENGHSSHLRHKNDDVVNIRQNNVKITSLDVIVTFSDILPLMMTSAKLISSI